MQGDFFFFFFQAEDGIRDIGVTGVQTCALPISTREDGASGVSSICPKPRIPYLLSLYARESGHSRIHRSCSGLPAEKCARTPAIRLLRARRPQRNPPENKQLPGERPDERTANRDTTLHRHGKGNSSLFVRACRTEIGDTPFLLREKRKPTAGEKE